jgi:hypothetical protein
MRHRDSDADLFEHAKTEHLLARVQGRMSGVVQSICSRLVGMGRCSAQCPCAEYHQIGMPWLEDEISEALSRQRFSDDGKLDVRLVEDDFRRRWNRSRGLVQEPLNNKLVRSGKITDWGDRFLHSLRENPLLEGCGPGDDIRLLKLSESWLRHLWDDASDNAEMTSIRKGDFSEMWYVHPESVWPDDTKRRFGYRADRMYRRRITDAELREMDLLLPKAVRPEFASTGKVAESDEFFKVSRLCDALLTAVETADAPIEKYQAAPDIEGTGILQSQVAETLGNHGVSVRVGKSGELEISSDDLDRLDDGIVDMANPRTLFDDFAAAWAMTRMNTHEQMTLLNQSVNGPSDTSRVTHGDLLTSRDDADDAAEDYDPDEV